MSAGIEWHSYFILLALVPKTSFLIHLGHTSFPHDLGGSVILGVPLHPMLFPWDYYMKNGSSLYHFADNMQRPFVCDEA